MPSISMGFCVARTKNGWGRGLVSGDGGVAPASPQAGRTGCRGAARLISSARTRLAKIGKLARSGIALAYFVDRDDHRPHDVRGHQIGVNLDVVEV